MMQEIAVERWLSAPAAALARRDVSLRATEDAVAEIGRSPNGRGLLALAPPVNAHDHGYGVRTLDFGCVDDALEPWIAGLRVRPPTSPFLETLAAFGRLALNGSGATMHCHNSLVAERLEEDASEVVRAAGMCGIRLGLSCPLLDASPWVYGGPEALRGVLTPEEWDLLEPHVPRYQPIDRQIAAIERIAKAHKGAANVDIQFGPIGPQWCSNEMLEAIAAASRATGRRIHMHLLESPRQRRWLDRRFPEGIVTYLDRIGFLSPRLAVAHGVQLTPDECEILADRGVTVVTNPSANLRLRSGVAPLGGLLSAGVPVALGLDGTGFDDEQDMWQELRLLRLLHGGCEMESAIPARTLFDIAGRAGSVVIGQRTGGDLAVIDYASLIRESIFDDIDEADVLLARMKGGYVKDLYIAGRQILADRRLTGFDYPGALAELVGRARSARAELEPRRAIARKLSEVVKRFYET